MRYLPLTEQERKEIQGQLGIGGIDELFTCIEEGSCLFPAIDLPPALSEPELLQRFAAFGEKNRFQHYTSFLGAGSYRHFIPEVVQYLSTKGEFVTPYTPYQPEVSQGNLQAMFEYQTMITMLTGMDIANASLYDGGTAAAEGVLLAVRKSGKKRILVSSSVHPEYQEIIRTYCQNLNYNFGEIGFQNGDGKVNLQELQSQLNGETAGFLFQSPNFFGVVEESRKIGEIVHNSQSFAIQVVAEAMSLPFLTTPGANDIDIAVGEAQSFGLPMAFGGPSLGFMAVKEMFLRQMPGRVVGQTVDIDGKRGYVLTLSTREQHIKREKATSNICSNQAWCAVRAAMYLSTMGKQGLESLSRHNHMAASYFVHKAAALSQASVKYSRDYFNEVVLEFHTLAAKDAVDRLREKSILAGVPLSWFYPGKERELLINFTEMHDHADIERLLKALGELK